MFRFFNPRATECIDIYPFLDDGFAIGQMDKFAVISVLFLCLVIRCKLTSEFVIILSSGVTQGVFSENMRDINMGYKTIKQAN